MTRGYLDTADGQLHYRSLGSGRPILLLHQTPSSSLEYEPLLTLLGEKYRAVALDTPGYGMSDPAPRHLSIPEYAAVAADFLRRMDLAPACVLGHHTGASIALELAVANPELISAAVFSSLPFYPPDVRASRLADSRFEPLEIQDDGAHLRTLWRKYECDAPHASPAARHSQILSALQAGAGDKEAYQAVFRYQEQARLPGLKAPTLLISGEIDLFHGCLETTRDLIPDCEVGVIPGGDGLVTADRTPEFAALTLAFLKRIGYV